MSFLACVLGLGLAGMVLTAHPMRYFVDPVAGNDAAVGTEAGLAWKTLGRLNEQTLGPGDEVTILPGSLEGTMAPQAKGSVQKPVIIRFGPGRHLFKAEGATRLAMFVSNSADAPREPRPVAIHVFNATHLKIIGDRDSEILLEGRMTFLINDRSQDVTYEGLRFDMVRPTVSEFRVLEADSSRAVVQIADGSTFEVVSGRFRWTGDLGPGPTMVQELNLETGECRRRGIGELLEHGVAEKQSADRVLFKFPQGNPGIGAGWQYQFRNIIRDTTSAVNNRCRDIVFRDCSFYALPGMGIVSQFTENVTFQRVSVAPKPGTLRTCPAWADCFHFSGCRGKVLVDACTFSGTQDDPVNVHGTHLRLIERVGPNQVLARFMHPQTYGFAAFQPGDSIEFVNHVNLLAYASARVAAVERRSDTDWVLGLDVPVPEFKADDVVDNVSWYPDVTIRNCIVDRDSCRGLLITTRGKVVIEGNTFANTEMSAILIADDANSWFESGPVRDVTIRRNRFIRCGSPVISIHPENQTANPEEPVHSGIRILDNIFESGGISARSVRGLTIRGNTSKNGHLSVQTEACSDVKISGNGTTMNQRSMNVLHKGRAGTIKSL